MEGKSLIVGATYLFRLRGKQVPVMLTSNMHENGKLTYRFHRITGPPSSPRLIRNSARALSKHFDSCAIGRESCDCAARLATLSLPYNSTGEQTE